MEERRTEEINGEMDFEEWEEKKKQKEAKDIDNIKAFLAAPASDVPDWMEKQLRWQYSFNGSVQTPAKLTATAAVALKEQQESGAEGIEPFYRKRWLLPWKAFLPAKSPPPFAGL